MDTIGIVTEETVDLSPEIVKKHGIFIVPAILNWPELEKMPGNNTFQKMRDLEKRDIKSFGKTSQPTPNDYYKKYTDALKQFNKIICITLTSKLSGGYNSANLAIKLLDQDDQQRVFVVDSANGSCGQALVVLKAVDLINDGKHIEEVVKDINTYVTQVYFYIVFDDPKWIEASGRIPHTVASIMKGLTRIGVRPVLTFKEGMLHLAGIKTRSKDITTALFKQLLASTDRKSKGSPRIRIAIAHGDDVDGANRLKSMIENTIKNVEIDSLHILNNTVGALTGPNTLAVAWSEV